MELDSSNHSEIEFELGADDSQLSEVYLADGDIDEGDNGLIWKEILREGEWAYRPGPGQKPIPVPLKVVFGNASTKQEIGMADLIEAFEGNAVDHVTVPTSHDDKPHENTGYVRALKTEEVDGKYKLLAGIDFTEPDIKGKAIRRTIANTSAGIIFDYIKKDSGQTYKQVLGHVALTNKPWINGMEPFSMSPEVDVAFSDEQITPFVLSDSEPENAYTEFSAEEIKALKDLATKALGGDSPSNDQEETLDDNTKEAMEVNVMATEETKPEETRQEETSNDPAPDATLSDEAREALKLELSESFQAKLDAEKSEKDELKAKVHKMEVEEKITELKKEGFSEYPGLLKAVREIMLADTGKETLTLSEETDGEVKEVSLSVTQATERILDALPKQEGKVNFGEQHDSTEDKNRPDSEVEEKSTDEKIAEFAEALNLPGFDKPKVKDGDA